MNDYKTNDLIELQGGLDSPVHDLTINGRSSIRLSKPEFILFFILAAHSLTRHGLPSPRRIEGDGLLSGKDLLKAVETWRQEEPGHIASWVLATDTDVYRAVYSLRKKLSDSQFNSFLLETGKGGYQLSTPPSNITLLP
jgi:hypothetical protein